MQRWILFGASRGLGWQVAQLLAATSNCELINVSRKPPLQMPSSMKHLSLDLSKPEFVKQLEGLVQFQPTHILYAAGGGPFGDFQAKAFKDHQWAWRVTFEAAAQVLHWSLQQPSLAQATFIGSQIAENKADPGAASYCAAKHALKGLIESVKQELQSKHSTFDLRLFSPGYMNTDLLPANAWPRQHGVVEDPAAVAEKLVEWLRAVC